MMLDLFYIIGVLKSIKPIWGHRPQIGFLN